MLKIANCNILNEEALKFYNEYESAKFILSSTINEFNSEDLDENRLYLLESIDDIQVSLNNLKNVIENSFINDEE